VAPSRVRGGDVATTKQALDVHDGPAVLVGHSYGGAVITEAGNYPAVKALVSSPPTTGDPASRAAGHVRANRRDNRRGRSESRRLPRTARRRRRAHLRGGRSGHVPPSGWRPGGPHPPAGTAFTPAVPAASGCTAWSLPAI